MRAPGSESRHHVCPEPSCTRRREHGQSVFTSVRCQAVHFWYIFSYSFVREDKKAQGWRELSWAHVLITECDMKSEGPSHTRGVSKYFDLPNATATVSEALHPLNLYSRSPCQRLHAGLAEALGVQEGGNVIWVNGVVAGNVKRPIALRCVLFMLRTVVS